MTGVMFDCLMAVALIVNPLQEQSDLSRYVYLRPIMQKIALEWEILDPREVKFLLARNENFSDDVRVIQQLWVDLKDAPRIDEALRFPDRTMVSDLLAFNRSYRSDLKNISEIVGGHARLWYEAAIQETDILYRVWEKVRDARTEFSYITVRRQALKDLREMIGPRAFYTGELPPYVPVWHYVPVWRLPQD